MPNIMSSDFMVPSDVIELELRALRAQRNATAAEASVVNLEISIRNVQTTIHNYHFYPNEYIYAKAIRPFQLLDHNHKVNATMLLNRYDTYIQNIQTISEIVRTAPLFLDNNLPESFWEKTNIDALAKQIITISGLPQPTRDYKTHKVMCASLIVMIQINQLKRSRLLTFEQQQEIYEQAMERMLTAK
jgi:hypothetical protein